MIVFGYFFKEQQTILDNNEVNGCTLFYFTRWLSFVYQNTALKIILWCVMTGKAPCIYSLNGALEKGP